MHKWTILIIDDDEAVLTSLGLLLKSSGYSVLKAEEPQSALKVLASKKVDLVVQDMNFKARQTSGEEGMELLKQIKSMYPILPVVLMTAWGSISLAVAGLQAGAADFITKPWHQEQVLQTIKTHQQLAGATSVGISTRASLAEKYDFGHIIGEDPQLLHILEMVGRVSQTDAPILITGESGTGKELIAEAVHKNSFRAQYPLVAVNLGSIPSSLFESELFGHVKGAFTDAKADRKGRFAIAEKGTIFLDEIGDLDYACQVKLLRVLQDRTFEPVGSSHSLTANVRVVSATNRNLMEMVQKGEFREDLLYRLNLIAVHLPALRERKGDIPALAQHFVSQAAKVYRKQNISISEQGKQWLQQQPFPGNIRELRHLIERAVIISQNHVLQPTDFIACNQLEFGKTAEPLSQSLPQPGTLTLDEMEKSMVVQAIEHFGGNLAKAADSLGISRYALYRRMEKFGLQTNN